MSIEELKEKARLMDDEISSIILENPSQMTFGECRALSKAQQDKDFKTLLKFCKENNIKQVAEGELPSVFYSNDDYKNPIRLREDIVKWHKQSLKEVRF